MLAASLDDPDLAGTDALKAKAHVVDFTVLLAKFRRQFEDQFLQDSTNIESWLNPLYLCVIRLYSKLNDI